MMSHVSSYPRNERGYLVSRVECREKEEQSKDRRRINFIRRRFAIRRDEREEKKRREALPTLLRSVACRGGRREERIFREASRWGTF